MFHKLNLLLLAAIVVCLGCLYFLRRDDREPNYDWIPERQMARSPAYGSFKPNPNFPDDVTFRQPAAGTIARGMQPFAYGRSPEEAARAGKELQNPLSIGYAPARAQGAALYTTYCQCCHGPTGMGDGHVSGRGFPAPLSFLKPQAMDMKDGEMFHILTYGKGNMPAHSLQLTPADRWLVILHVRVLQNKYTEFPNVRLADTIQTYKTNCLACHGDDGSGRLLRGKIPNLPDFSSLAWHFSKTNLEITNRIEYGDEPLMPSFRYKLTRDQILALSIYIRSFAVKEGAAPKPAPPATAAGMTDVQIFRAYCLACHNTDGKGAIVRPIMPDIPDFTNVAWHEGRKDAELTKSILSGGKFMPSMKDKLTAADSDTMAKFVRKFQGGKYVVELEPIVLEPPPFRAHPLVGASTLGLIGSPMGEGPLLAIAALRPERTEFLESEMWKNRKPIDKDKSDTMSPEIARRLRSASIVYRSYCIACHGPDGTGVAAMRATLPLLPDFTKAAFQDQHSDSQLLISILDGKGAQMPANRGRVTEVQARDLILVVRNFGPAGLAPPPSGEFEKKFEELVRQWEALERELHMLKQAPPKRP
jgi:mono/diheme cytochrome c family protein